MVKNISNIDQFKNSIEKNKLNIIDFWATWCGPCVRFAPEFEKLSHEYPTINFFKIDVDESKELSKFFKIECMPTFIFIKNNQLVNKIEGADLKEIVKIINQHEIKSDKNQNEDLEEIIEEILEGEIEDILSEEIEDIMSEEIED